jgi:ribose-phosphate pyrophosphokinase
MKILNLTNKEKSEIPYRIINFSDGQRSFIIDDTVHPEEEALILSHLNEFNDLELIICANKTLKERKFKKVHLYTPYFLGGRSDRRFQEGSVNYLKEVICPIINLQGFDSVKVYDPHSDVLEACLDSFEKETNFSLVEFALKEISKDGLPICVVSPDAGALKKIYDVVERFKIPHLIVASKHRDIATGRITHTDVPSIDPHMKMNYLIIDDICDGGRTFTSIGEAFKLVKPSAKLFLCVSHGIFSSGFQELSKYFETIFTTDSIQYISCIDGYIYSSRGTEKIDRELVKQLKLF